MQSTEYRYTKYKMLRGANMHKGNPKLSHKAEAEQSVTEHTLSSALMTEAVGLASASKWHDFGWRPTRRPGTRTGPYIFSE
jgi:hypothetical protein